MLRNVSPEHLPTPTFLFAKAIALCPLYLLLVQYRMTKDYTDFKYVYPRTMDKLSIAFIVMTLCKFLLTKKDLISGKGDFLLKAWKCCRCALTCLSQSESGISKSVIGSQCRLEGRQEAAYQLPRCGYC